MTMTRPGPERVDVPTLLAALAEPHRQRIVRLLERKQLAQRDLMTVLDISQPLVSHHIKVLREAGLIESTICERITVYRLRSDMLDALGDRLTTMAERARRTGAKPPC
jgi:ArsR family transcriptional regulator, arsenate/arsenite/antimonite-responsive transcriptional repressor